MELTVTRDIKSTDDATLGNMYLDDEFFCYTLEDEHRDEKVMHETRIPAGRYKVILRNEGGMNGRYAKRYPFHEGMLWLRSLDEDDPEVPEFLWIYIHPGNTDDHTSGCILVGDTKNEDNMTIGQSRDAYSRLYQAVVEAAKSEELFIEVKDE